MQKKVMALCLRVQFFFWPTLYKSLQKEAESNNKQVHNRPDGKSDKTSTSGSGDMGFKSRANQIEHIANDSPPAHHYNLEVWALAQSRRKRHRSLVTPKMVLSEYNEDLILNFWYNQSFYGRGK